MGDLRDGLVELESELASTNEKLDRKHALYVRAAKRVTLLEGAITRISNMTVCVALGLSHKESIEMLSNVTEICMEVCPLVTVAATSSNQEAKVSQQRQEDAPKAPFSVPGSKFRTRTYVIADMPTILRRNVIQASKAIVDLIQGNTPWEARFYEEGLSIGIEHETDVDCDIDEMMVEFNNLLEACGARLVRTDS